MKLLNRIFKLNTVNHDNVHRLALRASKHKRQSGGATVELTLTLFILLALTIVYWEFAAVFFVQQRLTHATFMAERSNTVDGNASSVVAQLNGGEVSIGSGVRVQERVNLPVNLEAPWDGRGMVFRVQKEVDMPREPRESGDNR